MAETVTERRGAIVPRLHSELDLVSDQVVRVPLHLHLDPCNAAALPVRSADAARVEGVDPTRHREPGGDRNRESDAAVIWDSRLGCDNANPESRIPNPKTDMGQAIA